jgi:uncharacterized protein YodC (DUF2158 family)
MAMAFKPRDVVQLISGGPRMTVAQMGAEAPDRMVWCVWSEGGKKVEDAFPISALVLAPNPPNGEKDY